MNKHKIMRDTLLLMQTEDHFAFNEYIGICGNFNYILHEINLGCNLVCDSDCYRNAIEDDFADYMKHAVEFWPKYSGDITYPVSITDRPSDEYNSDDSKWADNDYGNARRDLLQFLIDDLEILASGD